MIYTYPNPDVRRKTDDRNTSAFSGTDKRLPGMDQGAEENIALNERFVAKDIYSVGLQSLPSAYIRARH